jgi:BlaI family transcriptional regulator, penicillinase repressor
MQITDAEWEVMECIWDADEQTPAEIIERVQPLRNRSHRTIRTLLNRLVDKGAVAVRKQGASRLYSAAVSRKKCVMEAAKSFGERFFGGNLSSMLTHFVESEEISPSEAQALREKLDSITKPTKYRTKKPAKSPRQNRAKRG